MQLQQHNNLLLARAQTSKPSMSSAKPSIEQQIMLSFATIPAQLRVQHELCPTQKTNDQQARKTHALDHPLCCRPSYLPALMP
jgi:hypothetical protein